MRRLERRDVLKLVGLAGLAARGQEPPEAEVEWVCPMDPDIREKRAGQCPRCRMDLVAGIPPFEEYPLRLEMTPGAWRAGQKVRMKFEVVHPKTGRRVRDFLLVHERYFHLFVVSADLNYFAHEHPEPQADGTFLFETTLPKAGLYRVLGDFYPKGGTPQLAVKTILSGGAGVSSLDVPRLGPVQAEARGVNLSARLRLEPAEPVAGWKTLLFFELSESEGLEQYLGAWGHLLCASADLIDLIHTHPFLADGGPKLQFNVMFPRAGMHRLWPQFQRKGEVNTLRFDLRVREI
jgi:hypothetical protein